MQGLGNDEGLMGDKGEMVQLPKDQMERSKVTAALHSSSGFLINECMNVGVGMGDG